MIDLKLKATNREAVFTAIQDYLTDLKLTVVSKDFTRPWGGFFVIDETQAELFAKLFFPTVELASLRISGKLSPKILVVEPGKRLSWQYHHRRAEIWRSVSGVVGVVTSHTDVESEEHILNPGDEIRLAQGQRHRLVGRQEWGVLAEIWQHTDASAPSDENDIVRVQDDFGR
ncbi:MAG: phosphoheptose isomerase [Cyclobacteriaceae bacterium]|nr:phosphoheptose isomerase [Cyclobacteriaceae bacterium]